MFYEDDFEDDGPGIGQTVEAESQKTKSETKPEHKSVNSTEVKSTETPTQSSANDDFDDDGPGIGQTVENQEEKTEKKPEYSYIEGSDKTTYIYPKYPKDSNGKVIYEDKKIDEETEYVNANPEETVYLLDSYEKNIKATKNTNDVINYNLTQKYIDDNGEEKDVKIKIKRPGNKSLKTKFVDSFVNNTAGMIASAPTQFIKSHVEGYFMGAGEELADRTSDFIFRKLGIIGKEPSFSFTATFDSGALGLADFGGGAASELFGPLKFSDITNVFVDKTKDGDRYREDGYNYKIILERMISGDKKNFLNSFLDAVNIDRKTKAADAFSMNMLDNTTPTDEYNSLDLEIQSAKNNNSLLSMFTDSLGNKIDYTYGFKDLKFAKYSIRIRKDSDIEVADELCEVIELYAKELENRDLSLTNPMVQKSEPLKI